MRLSHDMTTASSLAKLSNDTAYDFMLALCCRRFATAVHRDVEAAQQVSTTLAWSAKLDHSVESNSASSLLNQSHGAGRCSTEKVFLLVRIFVKSRFI